MVNRRCCGFNLIEMVVVISILAILLSVMLPAYQDRVIGVRRSLAWAELLKVTMRQEQFLLNHGRYAQSLVDLGLPENPYAIDAQGTAMAAPDRDGVYLVSLVTMRSGYTLLATPQRGQADDRLCGTLSMDSSGRRQSTGTGALPECW